MFCLKSRKIISVTKGLFIQEITFISEFPGSNYFLPRLLTGGKWYFQMANLLLLIWNPVNTDRKLLLHFKLKSSLKVSYLRVINVPVSPEVIRRKNMHIYNFEKGSHLTPTQQSLTLIFGLGSNFPGNF